MDSPEKVAKQIIDLAKNTHSEPFSIYLLIKDTIKNHRKVEDALLDLVD